MSEPYLVSDGNLVLSMRPAGKGWYAVTCPFDPGITTQARSIEEAFAMAYDAQQLLAEARAELFEKERASRPSRRGEAPKKSSFPSGKPRSALKSARPRVKN